MNKIINTKPFILFLYGPTGVGKTDIALSLSSRVPSEIINMDVGQFYEPFSIGTAKPDWKNETTPHHLFDIIDKPISLTVVQYASLLYEKVNDIIARGKLPIVVGGSYFYLYSLFFPPLSAPTLNHDNDDIDYSWDALNAIDPERAATIEKSDSYRITRALDIWKKTGIQPTHHKPEYTPLFDFMLIYIIRDTDQLNNRINHRVKQMIDSGWIQETESLLGTDWQDFIRAKKLIGYNEIIDFLSGNQDTVSHAAMINVISAKTRQYAKRQRTFWRKLERELSQELHAEGKRFDDYVQTLNLTSADLQLYINELLERLPIIEKKYE